MPKVIVIIWDWGFSVQLLYLPSWLPTLPQSMHLFWKKINFCVGVQALHMKN